MDVISDRITKARKPWRCDGCGRCFEPGSQKRTQFNVDGGDHWTWKSCPTCDAITDALLDIDRDYYDYGVDQNHISEYMHETYGSWEAADIALAKPLNDKDPHA